MERRGGEGRDREEREGSRGEGERGQRGVGKGEGIYWERSSLPPRPPSLSRFSQPSTFH